MTICEACGSYILDASDIEALRNIPNVNGQHGDPVGEPGLSGLSLGTWTLYSSTMMECSRCQKHVPYHKYKYCPHCGSRNNFINKKEI